MSTNQLSVQNPDISTALVPYTVGAQTTDFTIDVSAANLLLDTTVKDFVVVSLTNNQVLNNSNFNKVSPTSIQYVGTDRMVGEQLEVQRRTPAERYQFIRYKALFDSAIYNQEIERLWRRLLDAELVGIGPGSGVSNAPIDEDYGPDWAADIFRSRVAKNLYDKFEAMSVVDSNLQAQANANATNIGTLNTNVQDNASSISALGGEVTTLGDDLTNLQQDVALKGGTNIFTGLNTFSQNVVALNGIQNNGGEARLANIRSTGLSNIQADLHLYGSAGGNAVLWLGAGDIDNGVNQAAHTHGLLYAQDSNGVVNLECRAPGGGSRSKLTLLNGVVFTPSQFSASGNLNVLSSPLQYLNFGANANDIVSTAGNWCRMVSDIGVNHSLSMELQQGGNTLNFVKVRPNIFQVYAADSRGINWEGWWYSNSISFGWDNASVQIKVDSSSIGAIQVIPPSDSRVKEDVKPLKTKQALSTLKALSPVSFKYTGQSRKDTFGHHDQYGLLAQQVLDVIPDIVRIGYTDKDAVPTEVRGNSPHKIPPGQLKQLAEADGTELHIEYMQLIPLLVAAVQELSDELQAMQSGRPNNP